MADQQTISIVVDKIVAAFEGSTELFDAFLVRSKLNTELEQIDSEMRNLVVEADASASAYVQLISAKAAQRAAKVAEIDALGSL